MKAAQAKLTTASDAVMGNDTVRAAQAVYETAIARADAAHRALSQAKTVKVEADKRVADAQVA